MQYYIDKTLDEQNRSTIILIDENLNIVEEVALFLHYLQVKGLSTNTQDSYCRVLKEYFTWLSRENLEFYDVTKRDMISFIGYINDSAGNKEAKSPRTINKYLATLASFYTYYRGVGGYISEHPIHIEDAFANQSKSFYLQSGKINMNKSISFFRQKETRKKNNQRLFPSQIEVLYEAINNTTKNKEIIERNKLIFKLLYETGLRIGECLGLRIKDYSDPDPSNDIGVIYLREHPELYHKDHSIKTNERDIPVSMNLIYAIDDYVCSTRPPTDKVDTIFVNSVGPMVGEVMKRNNITSIFSKLSIIAGIKCTPHTLRHTHGTELSESGYQPEYIQNRLGHNSFESTSKYVHLSLESQVSAYGKFIELRNEKGLYNDTKIN